MREKHWALGLMSGTSLDGLDAALIRTDGVTVFEHGPYLTVPMPPELGERLRQAMRGEGDWLMTERLFTLENAALVKALLKEAGMKPHHVHVTGFHGQTIVHRPAEGISWQIGDGALLTEKTGISTVTDFRRRDLAAGGEGAPLVPLYHAALARDLPLPVAILNIGGIANVTWIGRSEAAGEDITEHDILAFDTGPGNALLNDWMRRFGKDYDRDGKAARAGTVNEEALAAYLAHPYFAKLPPKSLDRGGFDLTQLSGLSEEDGAATLTAFAAASVALSEALFPVLSKRWLVTGGGRHNPIMMTELAVRLSIPVDSVESVGWRGDALEAEAFAFLAIRSKTRLPLTLPTSTGAARAVTGGCISFC